MVTPIRRFAVVGPGSIGCCVAAALMSRGHDVVFAARSPFTRLRVDTPQGNLAFEARCIVDPSDLGTIDTLVLATKAHQNGSVAHWLAAAAASGAPILVAQNGVDHVERTRALMGDRASAPAAAPAAIVPAVVYCAAHREGPGHAVLEGAASLTLPASESAHNLAGAFAGSFMRVELSEDWTTAAWTKLLMNAALGPICALTGRPMNVLADAGGAALVRSLMQEIVAVARAEGARLDDSIIDRVMQRSLAAVGAHMPSIAQDRLAGLPTEWQARNEVVVRLAARHGVPVPLNSAMTTLMRLGEPG